MTVGSWGFHYTLLISDSYFCPCAMAKEQSQITFEFSEEILPEKEFLSGLPVTRSQPDQKKKAKELEAEEPVSVPDDDILFQKAYWSMKEVAEMFKVKISLIRTWENEFDELMPKKDKKGTRYFRPVDVKTLELIYDLLRRRKFTIEGAKEYLRTHKKAKDNHQLIASLQKIKTFLLELKANL